MHKDNPFPAPTLAVTIREAQRATGLGRTSINNLLQSGQLRRVKVGKRTLIPFEDLQKLITSAERTEAIA
jgi:excisionase family DNA binding protein